MRVHGGSQAILASERRPVEGTGVSRTAKEVRPMPVLRKRLVAGLLAAAMLFTVVACSSDDPSPSEPDTPQVGS